MNLGFLKVKADQLQSVATNELVGKTIDIGSYSLVIERKLAEGGFAHVYLVRSVVTGEQFALKRIVIGNTDVLKATMAELQIMKQLSGSDKIVKYLDSKIIGQHEILILMEYCPNTLVAYLNSRFQSRLNDSEILAIFSSVCESVAYLHYQNPPIIHRDLKVENVLMSTKGEFKLCDFGSATTNVIKITNFKDIGIYEEEIQRFTTLAYRAPEMCDLYLKKTINEKSDIWSLGCLLYNLCYYKTPFEDSGQFAILNAKYQIPSSPHYSQELQSLIPFMLNVDPDRRPNIFQVLERVSILRNCACPIQNIYKDVQEHPQSEQPQQSQQQHQQHHHQQQHHQQQQQTQTQSNPQIKTQTTLEIQKNIVPMRRGRQKNTQTVNSNPEVKTSPNQFPQDSFSSDMTFSPSNPFNDSFGSSFSNSNSSTTQTSSSNFDDAFGEPLNTNSPIITSFDDAFGFSTSSPSPTSQPTSHPQSPMKTPNSSFLDPNSNPNSNSNSRPNTRPNSQPNSPMTIQTSVSNFQTRTHTRSQSEGNKDSQFYTQQNHNLNPLSNSQPNSRPSSQFSSKPSSRSHSIGIMDPDQLNSPIISELQEAIGQQLNIENRSNTSSPLKSLHSPHSPYPEVSTFNTHKTLDPSKRKKRRHQSQNRTNWVQKMVSQKDSPKSNSRKIIGELWKISDSSQPLEWVFSEILKYLNQLDAQSHLYSLFLLHRIAIEGPMSSLKNLTQKVSFIDNLRRVSQTNKVAVKRINTYSDWLSKKIHFLEKHPEFEGTYSLEQFFYYFQKPSNQPKQINFLNADFVKELVELYNSMDEMRELLFEMTPGEDIILYLIQSALVEESLSIYTLILHLTSKMKENPQFSQDLHALNIRTTKLQTSLASYCEKVSKQFSGCLFSLPTVPSFPQEKSTFDYPPSCGTKHLLRLSQREVDITSLSVYAVYAQKLKEAAHMKVDTSFLVFAGQRYDSAMSSDSE